MADAKQKEMGIFDKANSVGLALKWGILSNLPIEGGSKIENIIQNCLEKKIAEMDIFVSTGKITYKDGTKEKFLIPDKYSSALRILFWLLYKEIDPATCTFFKYGEDYVIDDPLHEAIQFYVVSGNKIVLESVSYTFVKYKDEGIAEEIFYCKDGTDEIWALGRAYERSLKAYWDSEFEKTATSRQYRLATGRIAENKDELDAARFNRLVGSIREVKILLLIVAVVQAIMLIKHLF